MGGRTNSHVGKGVLIFFTLRQEGVSLAPSGYCCGCLCLGESCPFHTAIFRHAPSQDRYGYPVRQRHLGGCTLPHPGCSVHVKRQPPIRQHVLNVPWKIALDGIAVGYECHKHRLFGGSSDVEGHGFQRPTRARGRQLDGFLLGSG